MNSNKLMKNDAYKFQVNKNKEEIKNEDDK